MEKILNATHQGKLNIGTKEIDCAVLADGTRVILSRGFLNALGRPWKGSYQRTELPNFIDGRNLIPFISEELRGVLNPILYKDIRGRILKGYKAQLLPMVCDVYLRAREEDALVKLQEPIAKQAEIIMRALAHIGIIALVDEVTGYQEIRDKLALQKILDKYLRKEFAQWAKRFPDEFYQLMFDLKGWEWRGMKVNRPSVVGKYTNDIIYARLAPGVLDELKKRNPPNESGRRKSKHHQWLTEDIGHPALQQHLYTIIAFMKASSTWGGFQRMVERAFPKVGETYQIPFDED
jgi:hypothetical protein